MDDLITRQAAIDAINTWDKFGVDGQGRIIRWHEGLEPYVHLRDVLTAIVNLPSAQPEQKTGKWIEKEICETRRKEEMQVAKCSNCGKYLTTPHIYSFNHYGFCPNCGAKMEGDA